MRFKRRDKYVYKADANSSPWYRGLPMRVVLNE